MYCGDETGAFIGDIGSHTSRFGYGGEDSPKHVVPSYVSTDGAGKTSSSIPTSCYSGQPSLIKPIYRMAQVEDYMQPQVDPTAYLQQADVIEDWDAYEHVWQRSFDVLRVRDTLKHTTGGGNLTEETPLPTKTATGLESSTIRSNKYGEGKILHPLMVVDSGATHIANTQYDEAVLRNQRIHLTELMMEKLDASALFVAPTPMLAAFSHGRQTCVSVDVAAGGCRVTPIVDGLPLRHAQRRNGRGGDWLGNVQWQALLNEKVALQPRYQLRASSNSTEEKDNGILHRWAMHDLLYEFRTSEHVSMAKWRLDHTTPFLYSNRREDEDSMQVDGGTSYELPDGTKVDLTTRVGKDLCRVPELLFSDNLPFLDGTSSSTQSSVLSQHESLQELPLHKLVHSSLSAVGDADARKELCGNIVLTGGSSLLPHMEQRLSYELTTVVPSSYKCKVLASRNSTERACAAWIGASVLTSLGSFQQLWLSRGEYEEYGATMAVQRFP